MTPLRVVAAALVVDGRVLAARRPRTDPLAGAWELPGGKVEEGESDAVALARELREELGIDVVVGAFLGSRVHPYAERPVDLVVWACELERGRVVPHEHDAVRWLGPDELETVPWAPADVPFLPVVRAFLLR